jgi:hypothetical protein
MHLLVDISAHGLGHLAQTAPVIEALQARVPKLRLTIRSALPRLRLEQRIAAGFDHVPEARDFGFVMRNAVDIDLAASATAYREFHHSWRDRIDIEAGWLKAKRIDAVLTNVAYLPLAAANSAGLPSASLCSLNWADLFIHYFAGQSWAAKIYDEISTAYLNADCFLRVSPGLPMAYLDRRREIGPIARLGERKRQALSRRLGINESDRWILLAMGGMEFRLPVESWQRAPGFSWLVPDAWRFQREDVRAYDNTGIDFSDLLASVDAVITKPGYGTLVEAACNGIPILCMQRDDWPETPYFSAWLAEHARSRMLSRGQLMQGEFIDELTQMWQQPAPARPLASGAEEAAELLQTALRLC